MAEATLAPSRLEESALSKSKTDQQAKTGESKAGVVEQQTGEQGQGDGKPKQKKKNDGKEKRKGKPGKIHIRLPPIEAYEKDLCFAAEAPGRVVVRLERLMGSDKIRPVDGKFMETLMQRLEEEENIAWERKIKLRKKAERERHRRLAIAGLMDPGPGMEDLYDHPVFRVNRILNRLSTLDSIFASLALKLPPIEKINPFEKDETGAFFKEYPTHRALRKECERWKAKHPEKKGRRNKKIRGATSSSSVTKSAKASETKVAPTPIPSKMKSTLRKAQQPPTKSQEAVSSTALKTVKLAATTHSLPPDMEEEDEYDEELLEQDLIPPESASNVETIYKSTAPTKTTTTTSKTSGMEMISGELEKEFEESLTALQKKYSVPNYDGFEEDWKPYRSDVIEKFCDDFEAMEDMYDVARDIFDLYTKQELATQEHLKGNKELGKIPAKSKATVQESKSKTLRISESTNKSHSASRVLSDEEELMSDEEWAGESVSYSHVSTRESKKENDQDGEMELELEQSASEAESSAEMEESDAVSSKSKAYSGAVSSKSKAYSGAVSSKSKAYSGAVSAKSKTLEKEPGSSSVIENTDDEEEQEEEEEEKGSVMPELTPVETDVEEEEEE